MSSDPNQFNRAVVAESLLSAKEDRKFLVDQLLRHRRRERGSAIGERICVPCVLGHHGGCKSGDCPCVHHALVFAERVAGRISHSLAQADELVEQAASA